MAILTLTLNPAIDLETTVDTLIPGQKLRCPEPRRDPGGGGINVARAVTLLGGQATAVIATNGSTLGSLLKARGVPVVQLPAPGSTRQNLSVIETATGQQYRFIFPGPEWTVDDVADTTGRLTGHISAGDIVVISGSLPPGMTAAQLCDMADRVGAAGAQVVIDTSGDALRLMSEGQGGYAMLRMDSHEAHALVGHDLPDRADTARVARDLVARGVAQRVIIARGADGSVLATADGAWFAPAVDVPIASVTGAGDSFVAGAVLAMERGADAPGILQWGCASATAAVTTEATELCDKAVFDAVHGASAAMPL